MKRWTLKTPFFALCFTETLATQARTGLVAGVGLLLSRFISGHNMYGYWPSVRSRWLDIGQVLFCVFMDRDAKKNEANIQPSYQTNLVNKGFIIWLLVKFCLRDTAGSPERARWLHLARSGNQSQRAIWFILPAHGASHIIKLNNKQV